LLKVALNTNKLTDPGGSMRLPNNAYKPVTNTAWVHTRLCKLQRRVHHVRYKYSMEVSFIGVFNATFNDVSVIPLWSVLLVFSNIDQYVSYKV
jgi:hypothetical protein